MRHRLPKSQPKPATAVKSTNGVISRGRGRVRGVRRGRNAGRGKPKTADELDAEMVDYFDATGVNGVGGADGAATTNGASQPATNGAQDLGMDEISVSAFAGYDLFYPANLILVNGRKRMRVEFGRLQFWAT